MRRFGALLLMCRLLLIKCERFTLNSDLENVALCIKLHLSHLLLLGDYRGLRSMNIIMSFVNSLDRFSCR